MNERRLARIQELIKERVAVLVDHELRDPRRGLITISRVRVDRELEHCTIYWTILGSAADRSKNAHMLRSAEGFVRRELAGVLHTRTVPQVRFEYDDELEEAQRIDALLADLRAERERAEAARADTIDDADGEPSAPPPAG